MPKRCEYKEAACPWHRKCHCRHGIAKGGIYRGTENMPFCYVLLQDDRCPLGKKEDE